MFSFSFGSKLHRNQAKHHDAHKENWKSRNNEPIHCRFWWHTSIRHHRIGMWRWRQQAGGGTGGETDHWTKPPSKRRSKNPTTHRPQQLQQNFFDVAAWNRLVEDDSVHCCMRPAVFGLWKMPLNAIVGAVVHRFLHFARTLTISNDIHVCVKFLWKIILIPANSCAGLRERMLMGLTTCELCNRSKKKESSCLEEHLTHPLSVEFLQNGVWSHAREPGTCHHVFRVGQKENFEQENGTLSRGCAKMREMSDFSRFCSTQSWNTSRVLGSLRHVCRH